MSTVVTRRRPWRELATRLALAALVAGAFWLSWELSLFSFVVAPVVMIPLVKFGSMVRRQAKKSLIKLADVTDTMQQSFSGIKVVKGFRREDFERERFARANEGYFRKLMRVVRAKATSRAIIEFLWNAGTAVRVMADDIPAQTPSASGATSPIPSTRSSTAGRMLSSLLLAFVAISRI